MVIANKEISTTFLKIIIRTYHGQTEIVMQYGGLRSSVVCVTTSCSNDSFASPTHRTNQWLDNGLCGIFYSCTRASHSSCSVFIGICRWRIHLPSSSHKVQLVTDPMIMPAKEEYACDSGLESLDKHEPRDTMHCHVHRRNQGFAVAEKAER